MVCQVFRKKKEKKEKKPKQAGFFVFYTEASNAFEAP